MDVCVYVCVCVCVCVCVGVCVCVCVCVGGGSVEGEKESQPYLGIVKAMPEPCAKPSILFFLFSFFIKRL